MKLRLLDIFILFLFLINTLNADEKRERSGVIFAAGNLKFVFPQLIEKFYKKYPSASVHIQYGSSGDLTSDILNEHREYDIFFSADTFYPNKIYKAHKSATKPKKYTQGLLILVVPSNTLLTNEKITILKSPTLKHITLANKASAPYGKAAFEVLKNLHYYKDIKEKIRYSSDVATAITNVIWKGDTGFLAKAALSMLPNHQYKNKYTWIEIDPKLYNPIIQAYVVSERGLKNKNAMLFLHFLKSNVGQKTFRDNGYKNITNR